MWPLLFLITQSKNLSRLVATENSRTVLRVKFLLSAGITGLSQNLPSPSAVST